MCNRICFHCCFIWTRCSNIMANSRARRSLLVAAAICACSAVAAPPKVILTVIVDDLGFNNVGWHQKSGAIENTTPHLTALAKAGVELDRHYVHFTCTPSRSSYLTGRLPVHVQQTLNNPDIQTAGIPRNMTALPTKLKDGGYKTVGRMLAAAYDQLATGLAILLCAYLRCNRGQCRV